MRAQLCRERSAPGPRHTSAARVGVDAGLRKAATRPENGRLGPSGPAIAGPAPDYLEAVCLNRFLSFHPHHLKFRSGTKIMSPAWTIKSWSNFPFARTSWTLI